LREPWIGPVVTVCGRPFGFSTWMVMNWISFGLRRSGASAAGG
jgi:hypothetical protein